MFTKTMNNTVQRALRVWKQKGVGETVRRAGQHFARKVDERRYLARIAPSQEELARQRQKEFSTRITFSVAVPLYNTPPDLLQEMIDSVAQQSYPHWELCLADGSDEVHAYVGAYCLERSSQEPRIRYQKLEKNGGISENTNVCLQMATGEYIALCDHDDLLTPDALYEMRETIEKTGADFLYSDELIFRHPKKSRVIGIRMKPSFSPDTLLTNNYICHLTVFSKDLLKQTGGFRSAFDGSQDHDLVLRLTGKAKGIAHVAKPLYLWRSVPGSVALDINSKRYAIDAGKNAVQTFLREQKGIDAEVDSTEVFPTMYRVRYPMEGAPSVRAIIDARKESASLDASLQELQMKAGWENCRWTILQAQGQQKPPTGFSVLEASEDDPRCPLWNRIGREAKEDYLLFLSGVPKKATADWMLEMLRLAQQPHAGAIGAKILFTNGDARHVGVIIGMGPQGTAGRLYFRRDGELEDAFFGQLAVVEDVSAVTDVLLVSQEKWQQAGGFDPAYGNALFEVDLCLRLMEQGYYNMVMPHARLWIGTPGQVSFDVGQEEASYPQDQQVFQQKNARWLQGRDPFYNANLSLKHENWRIG
ncbi:MAG: glycosyltransferase [Clostridia bacterium]|nr:glycosyltransferase [Clostridia bacterium]